MKNHFYLLPIVVVAGSLVLSSCAPATTALPPTAELQPSDTRPAPSDTAVVSPTQSPAPKTTPIVLKAGSESGSDGAEVEITYICNEGFLFTSSRGEKILVDAMMASYPPFGELTPEQRNLLGGAAPPFDGIDLILITHDDEDHYDFELIRKHMENDPKTVLVTTEKAALRLKEIFPGRVQTVHVDEGKKEPLAVNGIELEVLGLRHSQSDYNFGHVGFLFAIGGRRILHLGDFDNIRTLPDDLGEIDVAFVVYWASAPKAKNVIYMHWEEPSPYKPMQKWILK